LYRIEILLDDLQYFARQDQPVDLGDPTLDGGQLNVNELELSFVEHFSCLV